MLGERKSASLDLFRELYGARLSKAGVAVNWRTALNVTTVLACCRVVSQGVAQVPLKLMRDSPDGRNKLPATDHQLYRVLYRRANAWQTSFELRETIMFHLMLCGNAFCFINRSLGEIVELIPIQPQHVTVNRTANGALSYRVEMPGDGDQGSLDFAAGSVKEFPAEAIWHIKGSSWNSYTGLEVVYLAREAIGLGLATEQTHADLHRAGVQTSGLYSIDGPLNPEQYKSLRDWLDKYRVGGENAGSAMILDRGAKWISQAMTGVDAQHLETRRLQIEEICRALQVIPIMVGYSDKATTYASAEQMFLAHVVHTLAPWYERLEQSIAANLLTEKEVQSGLYACFVEEGLLRGSIETTMRVLLGYSNGGLMTQNEARAKLDLNPDPDPESDKLHRPANIGGNVPGDKPADTKPPTGD